MPLVKKPYISYTIQENCYSFKLTKSKPFPKESALQSLMTIKEIFDSTPKLTWDQILKLQLNTQDIHMRYNEKLGFCGKLIDKIKSVFVITTRSKVNQTYKELQNKFRCISEDYNYTKVTRIDRTQSETIPLLYKL